MILLDTVDNAGRSSSTIFRTSIAKGFSSIQNAFNNYCNRTVALLSIAKTFLPLIPITKKTGVDTL